MREFVLRQKQVVFFIVAGGLSAVLEIGSFKLFSMQIPTFFPQEPNLKGIHYPLSNVFSTGFGIFSNYFLSIWFVFERGKHSKKKEFTYFMLVSLFSTLLSLLFFQLFYLMVFTDNFHFKLFTLSPEILSKVSAIVLVSVLNYSVKKRVIFNG